MSLRVESTNLFQVFVDLWV